MMHDSVDTIWHTIRQKKGCYKQAKRLLFRAPAMKESVLRVKFRAADDWMLHRCRLANGMFRVENAQSNDSLMEIALRECEVKLFSDDDCVNGIKLTSNVLTRTLVFMNVAVDDDAFLWFAMLHMEISVAQNSSVFPLTAATMVNTPLTAPSSGTPSAREEKLATDQAKSFRDCTVVGTRVEEIEKYAREQQVLLGLAAEGRKQQQADSYEQVQPHPVVISESSAILSSADITRFFQHLDAVGSGKVSSAGLAFTMKLITRHIHSQKPLAGFSAALDAVRLGGHESLSLEEFAAVMANVTHPTIVELVRKESHNDIQCI
ncbi:hypothetical protein PC121_g16360 [Phytophthora cactorum]|nr:hypothetical protein PC120_g14638 [Phytophthora cactorum]KAG3054314.1 hypothetical protein PC121_g16360 [Phytophthora cactorum]KAG4050049.1 hypothetical protein PC123_g14698 [Phytophthora cactorum]